MKNLQVLTPHLECIFNCPFCIAKSHTHSNNFKNNYNEDYDKWKNNLIKIINDNNDLKYVIITGTNEPMQSKDCVKDIIDIVRKENNDIQIEIQTRYYNQDEVYNFVDVVAYSISNPKLLNIIKPIGKIQRYVFILTNNFNNYTLEELLEIVPKSVKQLTFKLLEDSNGSNLIFDKYIFEHKVNNNTLEQLRKDINNYQGNLSIRLDENCMDSINRYKIFREDANLYESWDDYSEENSKTFVKKR